MRRLLPSLCLETLVLLSSGNEKVMHRLLLSLCLKTLVSSAASSGNERWSFCFSSFPSSSSPAYDLYASASRGRALGGSCLVLGI